MFFFFKNHIKIQIILLSFILLSCQLKEPSKKHGILFLKNRSDKLIINKSNINDTIDIIGYPHSRSISNDNEWFYIERVLTKGEYIKLGQNVLKTNNVLILNFDKYGVLVQKKFLDKNSKESVEFSQKNTENKLSQKSFIEKFLNSLKLKMYKRK